MICIASSWWELHFLFTDRGLRFPVQGDKVWNFTSFSWNCVWKWSDFNGGLMLAWASLSFPESIPTLALLWKWLELPDQVQLQASKLTMEDGETEVTEQGWWFGLTRYQVCNVFEWSKLKTHEPNGIWGCLCRICSFGQVLGVFQLERVSGPCQACYVLYIVFILV